MRIKTLGIVLMSAMALFTAFYWVTDPARRETAYQTQIEELVAYGQQMFGPPTRRRTTTPPTAPAATAPTGPAARWVTPADWRRTCTRRASSRS